MIKIADLLDRDFSKPIEEAVKVNNHDPDTVFTELTEYVATDRIRTEYECLLSAMAAAAKSPSESAAVWISGSFGSGKTSFAKNLGYVLANREVLGAAASSLFLKQVDSRQVTECVEFLNRTTPCEIFMLDAQMDLPAQANAEQMAEAMYRIVLRELGDDLQTHASTASTRLSVRDFVEQLFDICEIRRPGKTFAFIVDELGPYVGFGGERLKSLRVVVEQFGKTSLERFQTGKIPGPAWIIVTAEEKLHEALQDGFKHQIDLSTAGIREVAARRVLRKKKSQESVLRKLFRDHGAALIQNVKLERCSRRTVLDEDEFVQFYPYLPHLMDLAIDIVAGIRLHPNAPKYLIGGSRTIVKQCSDLLMSDPVRLADQPVGTLVSIDKIYDLLEGSIPPEKLHDVMVISEHGDHKDHPGMAERVTKAICLMELAKPDLLRTTNNIAALLVQEMTEAPPTPAVAAILDYMRDVRLVRYTANGWELHEYGLNEMHRGTAALDGLRRVVGTVNPRPPGWHNELIQFVKKSLARALGWYTGHLHRFNSSVTRSLEDIVKVVDPLADLPIEIFVLQKRLAQSEKRIAILQQHLELLRDRVKTLPQAADAEAPAGNQAPENPFFYVDKPLTCDRTAYVIGLFGTGRLYVGELIRRNLGERARYYRDGIRLHIGPTAMIYSGHATIRRISRGQNPPAVTSRILEAVRAGFADLIFIYRHPLDSLLTNWVWWRAHLRDYSCISGIAQVYPKTEDLCTDLEKNFLEFKAFAEGDPAFFAGAERGPRFLSFPEFVEETEFFLQSGVTLALRFEDFAIDPVKEFSKIATVMSVDLDLTQLRVAPPRSKPYGYLAVKDKVPRFRDFIEGLDAETKRRMERIGYNVSRS